MTANVPVAVIDANILYRRYPRNLVVWLAVERAFGMVESEHLFEELREHLLERNQAVFGEPRADRVERTIELIQNELNLGASEVVSRKRVEELVPDVEANDPDDRHVLAAAVAAAADCIVTDNIKDFDEAECARHGIGILGLDDFLMRVIDASTPDAVRSALENMSQHPPNSMEDLLDIVGDFAPRFAAAARAIVDDPADEPEAE